MRDRRCSGGASAWDPTTPRDRVHRNSELHRTSPGSERSVSSMDHLLLDANLWFQRRETLADHYLLVHCATMTVPRTEECRIQQCIVSPWSISRPNMRHWPRSSSAPRPASSGPTGSFSG